MSVYFLAVVNQNEEAIFYCYLTNNCKEMRNELSYAKCVLSQNSSSEVKESDIQKLIQYN